MRFKFSNILKRPAANTIHWKESVRLLDQAAKVDNQINNFSNKMRSQFSDIFNRPRAPPKVCSRCCEIESFFDTFCIFFVRQKED